MIHSHIKSRIKHKRVPKLHAQQSAHEDRVANSFPSLQWRLGYMRVIWRLSILTGEHFEIYISHWSLRSQIVIGKSQGRVVAIANSRNFEARPIEVDEAQHKRLLLRHSKRWTHQWRSELFLYLYRTSSRTKAKYAKPSTAIHKIVCTYCNQTP